MPRRFLVMIIVGCLVSKYAVSQETGDNIPAADAIADLLEREPITEDSWPIWRRRFLDWYYDRLGRTKSFEDAMRTYIGGQVLGNGGQMPENLEEDAVAWHLLGSMLAREPVELVEDLRASEEALRRSIELEPSFAGSHSALASTLISQVIALPEGQLTRSHEEMLSEAEREMQRALELDDRTRPAWSRGAIAFARRQYADAEKFLQTAMQDYPNSESAATWYAQTVLSQPVSRARTWSETTADLVKKFPDEGRLQILHAAALSRDEKFAESVVHLDRGIELGTDPAVLLGLDAVEKIRQAARLFTPAYREGVEAFQTNRFKKAERLFREALRHDPENVEYALAIANSRLSQLHGGDPGGTAAAAIKPLVEQFPKNAQLRALYAVALAAAERYREAQESIEKARELGGNPNEQLGEDAVGRIYEESRPSLIARILYGAAFFVAVYAVIMILMAVGGTVLGFFTRGTPSSLPTVVKGRVVVSGRERVLAKLYGFALVVSLILFYVAVPFVSVGVILATVGLLFGFFMMPVIPVYLLILVAFSGLAVAFAVLKSIFAKPEAGAFGIEKGADVAPRLIDAVKDVASAVGTDFADVIYVGPGSAIGVHQEGRGPFGILGAKRRVLTLGFSMVRCLTVGELKAILAHEYAHFSHQDTFYSRFIWQVAMSIEQALTAMGYSLGTWNYVNPFYWFFYLYYRSFSMLAAGFSRSREYLADRMAVSLYGKSVFLSGLKKVATEGQLFEATVHHNVMQLLNEGKAFANIYEAFRTYRDEQVTAKEREDLYQQMLDEKPSLISSHPTIQERIAGVTEMPDAESTEPQPASELFDNVEQIEEELTQFLTGYYDALRQMAAQTQQYYEQ